MGNAELCRGEEPWAPQSPDENGKRETEGGGGGVWGAQVFAHGSFHPTAILGGVSSPLLQMRTLRLQGVRRLVQMMEAGPGLTMGMEMPLVPQETDDEDAGGSDGGAQVMWEPEEDPSQPGVSGAL